mgnify:FL=1
MDRKKKLRIYQIILLISGILIILLTFVKENIPTEEKIISDNLKKIIEEQKLNNDSKDVNTFYNVKYSGLDLKGNRFSIISNEGTTSDLNSNLVEMKGVTANFYFKDNSNLEISSKEGTYNNESLNIIFKTDVKALYENSELYADQAEFSNSNNYLKVSNNVKIIDPKGTRLADRLIFDINTKTLKITSLKNNKIKSRINSKWKKVSEF